MYIALFVISIVMFIAYLFASSFIYKNATGNKFSFSNIFSYELFLSKKKELFSINLLILLCLGVVFANNLIFLIQHYDPSRIAGVIFAFLSLCFFGAISIIPLSKLKEHFICSILCFGTVSIYGALCLLNDIRYYQIEYNQLFLISIVFDSLILIVGLICMFNPKTAQFNMKTDEEGKLIRPSIIPLATSEWLMIIMLLLGQVPLLVASMI